MVHSSWQKMCEERSRQTEAEGLGRERKGETVRGYLALSVVHEIENICMDEAEIWVST